MGKPRVIVCQHGARHRYAVARILERAGMLEALYTDSCEYSFLGKIAKAMGSFVKGSLKRLADRKVIGVPKEKIFTTDMPTYKYLATKKIKSKVDEYLLIHESMNKQLIGFGVDKGDILYCFEGENLGFIKYAKSQNIKIVLDVCLSPLTGRIVIDDRIACNDNFDKKDELNFIAFRENYFKSQAELADILLCPSEFVVNGIMELCPKYAEKIRICPYGSSIDYGSHVNQPVNGRYFWAGKNWIRKGLHYFAKAADELKRKYPKMEFRVAGIDGQKVMQQVRFKNITFLGKLDKQQIQKEYLSADAFVFPTLSEGMAGVVIEAIGAGCPVITTKAAGVDAIEDGKNGLIIPAKDNRAIFESIEKLYLDRHLRRYISKETFKLTCCYTEDAWKKRLLGCIEEVFKI